VLSIIVLGFPWCINPSPPADSLCRDINGFDAAKGIMPTSTEIRAHSETHLEDAIIIPLVRVSDPTVLPIWGQAAGFIEDESRDPGQDGVSGGFAVLQLAAHLSPNTG